MKIRFALFVIIAALFAASCSIISQTNDAPRLALSSIFAGHPTASSATITWNSNREADSQVEYGETTSYGRTTPKDDTLTSSHSVNLTKLKPYTIYHYRVISYIDGTIVFSPDQTLLTEM